MKTKTHYLYSFIIISLVTGLVITSVSKPKVKDRVSIDTTLPVETTPTMVTLPPEETDSTDENLGKIYQTKYYDTATYLFFFSAMCLLSYSMLIFKKGYDVYEVCNYIILVLIGGLLYTPLLIISIISMIHDTLDVNQYIILSFYLLFIYYYAYRIAKRGKSFTSEYQDGSKNVSVSSR